MGRIAVLGLLVASGSVYAVGLVGSKLGPGAVLAERYRLERLVGSGGMSSVWAALDETEQRPVALKVLQAALQGEDDMRRRFLGEARLASVIDHLAVVPILDVFELSERVPVLVMELLEGETLARLLGREGALPPDEAVAILTPVAEALAAAHEQGIVHRDIKPENIFLAQTAEAREPKVLDFGLAKLLNDDHGSIVLTRAGRALGTVCYMAPEQAFAEEDIDHRVDIWALGIVVYECLAGFRPVEAESFGHLLRKLAQEAITPLQVVASSTPQPIAELVGRMLSLDTDDRPGSMGEVLDVLASLA